MRAKIQFVCSLLIKMEIAMKTLNLYYLIHYIKLIPCRFITRL